MKRIGLWMMTALALSCFATEGAGEPLLLTLGVQAGMQGVDGQRVWIFGPIAEVGPSDGLQVRLGAELGILGGASLTQLETLVLFNTRLGARIYFGGGVGVAWVAEAAHPGRMQIPILGLVGLKTRPIGPGTVAIEAVLLVPVDLLEGPAQGFTARFSAGVLFGL